jgi:hypothetical protein
MEKIIKELRKDLKKMKKISSIYDTTSFYGAFATDFETTIEEHIQYLESEIKRLKNYDM